MLTSPHDSSNMSGSGVAYATPEYILYSGTLARAVMLKMRLLAAPATRVARWIVKRHYCSALGWCPCQPSHQPEAG